MDNQRYTDINSSAVAPSPVENPNPDVCRKARMLSLTASKPTQSFQSMKTCRIYQICDESRKPYRGYSNLLSDAGFNTKDKWPNLWTDNNIANEELLSDPTDELQGFNLPLKR